MVHVKSKKTPDFFMKSIQNFIIIIFWSIYAPYAQSQGWEPVPLASNVGFDEFERDQNRLFAFAKMEQLIYASEDGGKNWEKKWSGRRFSVNPATGHYFLIDNQNKLYRSTDKGSTWALVNEMPQDISHSPRLSFAGDTIYSYARDVVYRLAPGGAWVQIFQFPATDIYNCIVLGKHIWVQIYAFFMVSHDDGDTWSAIPATGSTIGMVATKDTVLFMYRSTNNINYFTRTTDLGSSYQSEVAPQEINYLYKSTNPFISRDFNGNLYTSSNGLTDWQPYWKKIGTLNPNDVIVYNSNPLICTKNGIIYKNGTEWTYAYHGLQDVNLATEIDIRYIGNALVCLAGGEKLTFSTDNGNTWKRGFSGVLPNQIREVNGNYVGIEKDHSIYHCQTNSDFAWERRLEPWQPFVPNYITNVGSTVLAMTGAKDGPIWSTQDVSSGVWNTVGSLNPPVSGTHFESMLELNGEIFTRVDSSLVVSANNGQTWGIRYNFNFPISSSYAQFFRIGPKLFVSQKDKRQLYVSNDAGVTFVPLTTLPNDKGAFFQVRCYSKLILLNTWNGTIGDPGSFYCSDNEGATWNDIGFPPNGEIILPLFFPSRITANDSTIFAAEFVNDLFFGFKNLWRYKLSKSSSSTLEPDHLAGKAMKLMLYPNLLSSEKYATNVEVDSDFSGMLRFDIFSMDGRLLETFTKEKITQVLSFYIELNSVRNIQSNYFIIRVTDGIHSSNARFFVKG
jgi:hypothetical protein